MKLLIILAALLLISASFLFLRKPVQNEEQEIVEAFAKFQAKYNKEYSTQNSNYRFEVFASNYKKINSHNLSKSSYKMAINQFADLTNEEFKSMILMNNLPNIRANNAAKAKKMVNAPDTVDWVSQGAVTPIKDQGQCGSCWSFSTTGVLEGISKIQGGSLQSFSEQQLVDCCGSAGYGCDGCEGAWPDYALDYVKDHGILHEDDYPYVAVEQDCQKNQGPFKEKSYNKIAQGDLDGLLNGVVTEPVSICVDASNWSFYSSGIFDDCSDDPQMLDHAVLLVGYTKDYWNVKNSWNVDWGMQGYIQLAKGDGLNTCGLANYAITASL